eukprot:GFYU01000150.1.p1 GENE.GFYU01000150.1~~GFYU01000150.1.p1  ORF type:complete len:207 (-),score=68.86 GFYU01000150.1:67-687(-)
MLELCEAKAAKVQELIAETTAVFDEDLANTVEELIMDNRSIDDIEEDNIVEEIMNMISLSYPSTTKKNSVEFEDTLRGVLACVMREDQDFEEEVVLETMERDGTCKLCGTTNKITIHHLVPKLILKRMRNAGKPKIQVNKYLVEVCRKCHNELHRLWGHGELAAEYQTVDMILAAPEIQPYLQWKRKKEGNLVWDSDSDGGVDATA